MRQHRYRVWTGEKIIYNEDWTYINFFDGGWELREGGGDNYLLASSFQKGTCLMESLNLFSEIDYYTGDIVYIVFNKFGFGEDEFWTLDYEPSEARFVAYNQLNSNRTLEYEDGQYYFSPDGVEKVYLKQLGNKFTYPGFKK